MISEEQFNILCFQGESNCVDYKRAQYAFQGADDAQKAELLKDILCFANAFRRSPAYILIGVDEDASGLGVIYGIDENEVIDDARLQQFVNSKTNNRIPFSAYPLRMNSGKILQVIEIDACVRGRPFYLKNDYARLHHKDVWVRAGTSSHIASPEEIAAFGRDCIELESTPDIKTSLVSENGDSDELVSLSIGCDIKQPDNLNQFQRKLTSLSGGTEYDRYMWVKFNVAKLHFRLKAENVSHVNAEDLKFKYELKCDDGSVTLSEAPSFARSPFYLGNDLLSSVRMRKTDLRPKEKDDHVEDIYLEVVHGGKFSIEVSVYGKNIPEPIKEIFAYSVSVEELKLSIRAVMGLGIILKSSENILDFTKGLVSCVKRHVASADINAAVLESVEKKVKALCN